MRAAASASYRVRRTRRGYIAQRRRLFMWWNMSAPQSDRASARALIRQAIVLHSWRLR